MPPPGASKRQKVRVGFRTLCSLALCAAAAGAAFAHGAIDVVGDYALPNDSYDHLAHGSRTLASGLAVTIAVVLAARGLRACCDIAAANRTRLPGASIGPWGLAGYAVLAVGTSCLLVGCMEWFDGRLDGVAVRNLGDAFGGSLALGLAITLICAALVAAVVYALAHWLVSHRDVIASIIAVLLSHSNSVDSRLAHDLDRCRQTVRRRTPHAFRLSKRGPPVTLSA